MTTPRDIAVSFWGTPSHAAQCLQFLLDNGVKIAAVVTQPDKPVGRGHKVEAPPVKTLAGQMDILVLQPASLKDPATQATIATIRCDYGVVVAYGKILPAPVLATAPPFINLHFSLLPKYRGAAPVQRAIMDGCAVTGVTVQHVAQHCDTGDIILQQEIAIKDDDTSTALLERCTQAGAPLLLDALIKLKDSAAPRIPQDTQAATHAAKVDKNDGFIVWERPADMIHNQVRGCNPWPGATTWLDALPVRVWKTAVIDHETTGQCPGTLIPSKSHLMVQTQCGIIELVEVQPASGKRMTGSAFIVGHHGGPGCFISWTRPTATPSS